jgi:hypothetical protein
LAHDAVRISPHARQQMAKRGVSEAAVRAVLTGPDTVLPGSRPGRRVLQGIATVGDPSFKALLRVVVDEVCSPPTVITVYATTQFRRYGAEP